MQTVYLTGVTVSSTTKADLWPGPTGHRRVDPETGNTYVLVQNGTAGTISDGAVLMQPTGLTTTGVTTVSKVVVTTGATVPAYCVNNTGGNIAQDAYFWGLQEGIGYGVGTGAIGDGLEIAPAAAGAVAAASGPTDTVCGVTISDVTTNTANRIHWKLPAGGPAA